MDNDLDDTKSRLRQMIMSDKSKERWKTIGQYMLGILTAAALLALIFFMMLMGD